MIAILIRNSHSCCFFLFLVIIQGFLKLVEKIINGVSTIHCLPHCNALDHMPSMAPALAMVRMRRRGNEESMGEKMRSNNNK